MAQPRPSSHPSRPSAEVRHHRLEKLVGRLRVSRAAPLQIPPSSFTSSKDDDVNDDDVNDDDVKNDDVKNDDVKNDAPNIRKRPREQFVPSQAPLTETKKLRQALARDRAWIADYWFELVLIILGLNVGPLLYYYFVTRTGSNEFSFETGVNFIDNFIVHLAAVPRAGQSCLDNKRLLPAIPAFARSYASLLALCASLVATAVLLWSKSELRQTFTHMKASTLTHLIIAYSWLDAMFAFSFANITGWITMSIFKLIWYILLIVFSHSFAGAAQLALCIFGLFVFSGLGKAWETGSFGVSIPNPNASSFGGEDDAVPAPPPPPAGGHAAFPEASVPETTPLPLFPEQPEDSLLANANRGAYTASKFTSVVVLVLFALTKISSARVQTGWGKAVAYGVNGAIILGAVGATAIGLRSSEVYSNVVHITTPLHA